MSDPRAFIAGVGAVLAEYPSALIGVAIDPAKGLPSRLTRLNSIGEIRQALDELYQPVARQTSRERVFGVANKLTAPTHEPTQYDKDYVAALAENYRRDHGTREVIATPQRGPYSDQIAAIAKESRIRLERERREGSK